ncbi:MAG: AMP-binding protein, partial [Muribaculaceae bacterium]|nr:AMP-binding protein [Muribaculaceae bacterium]
MNTPAPVIKQSYGSLNDIIGNAIRTNWNLDALTDMGGATLQYKEVAENIAKLHILFKAAGLRHDGSDKVALVGRNTSNWAVTFIACLTYGVVAVPILHEFTPETLTNIINHSDSALLFVDEAIWRKLDAEQMPALQAVLYIAEYGMPFCRNNSLKQTREHLNERFGEQYPADFKPDSFTWQTDTDPEQVALISYTSGSTGMSKGVMLPYRSIWSNIRFCIDDLTYLKPGDGVVNML